MEATVIESGVTTPKKEGMEKSLENLAPAWAPGQSGNPAGRPKGSRTKLSEEYTQALYDDFKKHGVSVIEKVRKERPEVYLTCISRLIPKDIKIEMPQLNRIAHIIIDMPLDTNELTDGKAIDLPVIVSQPIDTKSVDPQSDLKQSTVNQDPPPTHETDTV